MFFFSCKFYLFIKPLISYKGGKNIDLYIQHFQASRDWLLDGVAWRRLGRAPLRARGRGTPREARQPLIWCDPAFGCARVGQQGGQGEGQEAGVPHQHRALGERTPGQQGQPPHPKPGHVIPVRENRGGGHSTAGLCSRQRSSPFLQWASLLGKLFPSLGWGATGSTPDMGPLAGAGGQGGWQGGVPGTR